MKQIHQLSEDEYKEIHRKCTELYRIDEEWEFEITVSGKIQYKFNPNERVRHILVTLEKLNKDYTEYIYLREYEMRQVYLRLKHKFEPNNHIVI